MNHISERNKGQRAGSQRFHIPGFSATESSKDCILAQAILVIILIMIYVYCIFLLLNNTLLGRVMSHIF